MTRTLALAALAALVAGCTKTKIEPPAPEERAPRAAASEVESEPEKAPSRPEAEASAAAAGRAAPAAPAREPSESSVTRGGWSVGTAREDEPPAVDEAAQAEGEDVAASAGDVDGEGDGSEGGMPELRVNEYGAPIDAKGNPILTKTMADTASTAAVGGAAGANVAMRQLTRGRSGRGDELPPVEDAQSYDEEADALGHGGARDSSCGPGEVAQGYDPVLGDGGLCVPRSLAEACQRQGQLPVVVTDMGMDCAVPRDSDDAAEEALTAAAPIELPSCDEESVIVLLPDVDGQGNAFDCRLVAQLDQSTMRGLTGKTCDERTIVVKVYAGSSTDDAIKGDVSCL